MITNIFESPKKGKRLRVIIDNNKSYDFGYPGAFTYVDGADAKIKKNYQKRHLANSIEKTLITNLVPSPSLFAYYILWGKYRDIYKNANYLNKLWLKKHG
jgi:hypothetical protein